MLASELSFAASTIARNYTLAPYTLDLLRCRTQFLRDRPRRHPLEVNRSLRCTERAWIGRTDDLPYCDSVLVQDFQSIVLHGALSCS